MAKSYQTNVVDDLFEVKNAFYLGNYQQCIKEAQKIKSSADDTIKLMRDVFMYRSYICQKKYSIILEEVSSNSSTPVELRSILLLANYLASENEKPMIVADIEQKLKIGAVEYANNIFYLIAGLIFINEGNIETALKTLQNGIDNLECESVIVQCLLKMDRDDLAVKQVKKMQEKDDDAVLTQLALAWTNIALGKDKLQDAFYIYQEMIDKYSSTPLLLNAQACVLIMQEKYDQADKLLQEAIEKDSNDPETLINLTVVSRNVGKSFEVCNRYINQLKDGFPNHIWTKEYQSKENEFDRLCRQYEAAIA